MPEVPGHEVVAADAARVASLALAEDGARDITSVITVDPAQSGTGVIVARQALVAAGRAYADAVVAAGALAPISWSVTDGDRCPAGTTLGVLSGPLAQILRVERPLLNLLQRAAGIATITREYVDAVSSTGCRVLHTRKTTPGLRLLEVTALLAGGGRRHRLGLADVVLIKDNHWIALRASRRTLQEALAEATRLGARELQVEVESAAQLVEACDAGATRLLIDNQEPETVSEWSSFARQRRPGIEIEASGGITLANIGAYARAGADFVSVGALTHSAPAADIALDVGG